MKVSGFKWIHGMKSSLRLCLFLVLVGVTTAGAIMCTAPGAIAGKLSPIQVCRAEPLEPYGIDYAPSAAAGGLPEIKVFKADPMVLSGSESALYKFVVRRATKLVIVEAGNSIKEISNPSGATLDGTATGLPANVIPTGGGNTFMAYCFAYNRNGQAQAELTLSIETEPTGEPAGQPEGQTGATDDQTKPRSPQWLEQYSSPFSPARSSMSGTEPTFFDCPGDCDYCLKAEEAAAQGLNERCSEERCYYSPDNQQNWYCYRQAPGWCCKEGKVGPLTSDECARVGGFWFPTEPEALKRCQPALCWCCSDGKVFQAPPTQCAGACYSAQTEALERCQPSGWCCKDGKVGPLTQGECVRIGGLWFLAQAEALQRCQPATCWCCYDGKVFQAPPSQCPGVCYSTQVEALQRCQPTTCWCCLRGQVFQATQSQCVQSGGACYPTQAEATRYCQQEAQCWCCLRGQVFPTTQSQCTQSGGACYSTQSQAAAACQPLTRPPIQTPILK